MIATETSLRYLGWCPVCERDIKVRNSLLVHHGYLRPGHGYIIGDCFGVHRPPHELSVDTAEGWRVYTIGRINAITERLRTLLEGPDYLHFEHYDVATRKYIRVPGSREPDVIRLTKAEADALAAQLPSYDNRYDWEKKLRTTIESAKSELRHWEHERDRMVRLIVEWRPQPLRTVEEEIERQEKSRAERRSEKDRERERKIADEVAKIQKRIDSAVRNKNAGALADIYTSSKLRDLSGYRLSTNDALARLDRDEIWGAFGLIDQGGYVTGAEAHDILHDMKWGKKVPTTRPGLRYDRVELPWPAALGGGKAKRAR